MNRKPFVLFLLFSITIGCRQTPVETGFLEIGEARLYYEVQGAGSAVVLIHAGLLDRRMWDEQFGVFAQHHQVIRYDVREYGLSQGSNVFYFDHADLYALLDHLSLERVSLVGLSMGSRIALDFALEYPERVKAIVLTSPGLLGYTSWSSEILQNRAQMADAYQQRDFDRYIDLFLRARIDGPHRTPAQMEAAVRENVRLMADGNVKSHERPRKAQSSEPPTITRVAEISVPTLVIYGTLDIPEITSIAGLLVDEIMGAERASIPGAGHMVNMEQPKEFNRMVLDFLRR